MKAQDFNATQIGRKLDLPPNTVRSLVHRMQKNQIFHGTRGRPKKQVALPVTMEVVTLSVGSNPLQSLRESANTTGLSPATVMRIRNSKAI
jgi:DNA-binding IclR family transcriptional regulator